MSETLKAPDPLSDNLKEQPELIQDFDYQVALDARGRAASTPESEMSGYRNMASDWRDVILDAKDAEAEALDKQDKRDFDHQIAFDRQIALGARAMGNFTPAAEASGYRNMASDWRDVMLDAKDAEEAQAPDENKSEK